MENSTTNDPLKDYLDSQRAKTFDQILEDAECLKSGDYAGAETVLQECVKSNLNDMQTGIIVKKISSKTSIGVTDIRATHKALKKSNGSQMMQDTGQRILQLTLDRFYMGGEFLTRSIAGRFWEFIGSHWSMKTDEQVSKKVLAVVKASISPEAGPHSALISQAMALLRADRSEDEDVFQFLEEKPAVVNCRNGELVLLPNGEVELRPHSPRSYLTYCLDFDYDPEATCPRYDAALLDIFGLSSDPEDMARHWNEFFGYAIQPRRDIPAFLMLHGQGSNGKSKLVETMTRLIGPDGVASVRVETLDSQFGRSPLLGKLLMVDDDVDAGTKLPDGVLKQISERKRVSVEFKGQTPFDAVLNVLPIMLCNNFPVTSDVSRGLLRRAYVFPFLQNYEGREDLELFPAIWHTEMSGVLNRALEGNRRLRQRRRFLVPEDCEKAKANWFADANPLKAFMEECLEPAPSYMRGSASITMQHLYNVFLAWAKESGVKHIVARKRMKANLESMGCTISASNGLATIQGVQYNNQGRRLISRCWIKPDEFIASESTNDPNDFSTATHQ